MAKFRIANLPSGEKSNKNVVRVVKVRDLKLSKNSKGGARPGPILDPTSHPAPPSKLEPHCDSAPRSATIFLKRSLAS
jgi:hypothetical protein